MLREGEAAIGIEANIDAAFDAAKDGVCPAGGIDFGLDGVELRHASCSFERDLDGRGFVQAGHAQECHTRARWHRLTTSHLEDGLAGIATTGVARVGAWHGIDGRLSTTIAIGAQAGALDGERVGIIGDDAGAQEVGRDLGAIELTQADACLGGQDSLGPDESWRIGAPLVFAWQRAEVAGGWCFNGGNFVVAVFLAHPLDLHAIKGICANQWDDGGLPFCKVKFDVFSLGLDLDAGVGLVERAAATTGLDGRLTTDGRHYTSCCHGVAPLLLNGAASPLITLESRTNDTLAILYSSDRRVVGTLRKVVVAGALLLLYHQTDEAHRHHRDQYC